MQAASFQKTHATRLIRSGVLLFLLGLVTGLAVPEAQIPRMAVASHMEGVMSGLLLMAMGMIWPRLNLGSIPAGMAQWMLVYGAYTNWGNTLAASLLGAGGSMMPFASHGRMGTPLQEGIIGLVSVSMALSLLIGVSIVLWGAWRGEDRG
jgi:(hydroxyamino)benzene mutase